MNVNANVNWKESRHIGIIKIEKSFSLPASVEKVWEKGRVLNPNYADYKIPTAADMPTTENFTTMTASPDPHKEGLYGAKGLGEAVVASYAPAVSNAVYNAVGVRIKDLPITKGKVLKTLMQKKHK